MGRFRDAGQDAPAEIQRGGHPAPGPGTDAPAAVPSPKRGGAGPARSSKNSPEACRTDRGSATAEFAILLPAIVVVLAVLFGAGAYGVADVRTEEAARLAARAAARGEGVGRAEEVARQIVGDEGAVSVSLSGDRATVVVRRRAPEVIGAWGGPDVVARASALAEAPGAGQ